MTSLGRLIFFDQPGTGASDPVTPGALPTLEQWADSITAVLDDLGSREAVLLALDGAFATAALFAATHPSRTTALVVLEGYADPLERTDGLNPEECIAAVVAMWGTGSSNMSSIRTCRGTRRSGRRGRDMNAWRRAQGPSRSCCRSCRDWTCGRCFRQSVCRLSSSSTPTTRSSRLRRASTSPITYRARNTLSCRGATCITSLNRGASRSRRSPSSSPATRPTWPMIGFSPRCCSPTSWTRRAAPRRSATVTGMRCLTRTTPSSGRSSLAFGAAR